MRPQVSKLSLNYVYIGVLSYMIFIKKLASPEPIPQDENPNAKSSDIFQAFSNPVRSDQVKSVIDNQNSISNKLMETGMSSVDALQKGAASTTNNVSWWTTSTLANVLKIFANTMEAVKEVTSNTVNAGVRVGMNTLKMAGGAVSGALGFAKSGTQGIESQLKDTSSFFKNVAKNPDQYLVIPGISSINPGALGLPSNSVIQYMYDTNSDSVKAVANSAVSSVGSMGWLVTDTLADTTHVLENTLELIDNLKDTTVNTGYKLGENGADLTQTIAGTGYNMIENGLSSAGNQMDQLAKSFKDRVQPQKLVDVELPLVNGIAT